MSPGSPGAPSPSQRDDLRRGRELLRGAESVVVLTGAGISAESGVPTFRGEEGHWRSHRPEELATPEAFRSDPELVWSWYAWRRSKIAACDPNSGHRALARFALSRPGVTLVTQNVDGLHALAAKEEARGLGVSADPALPVELHGSIFRLRCSRCRYREPHRLPSDEEKPGPPPPCPDCRGALRPDVVWFGEPLPTTALERAFREAKRASACLVVGTSALVHPAASVPLATVEEGGTLVEVNPEKTPLSRLASLSLRGGAGRILPDLLDPA